MAATLTRGAGIPFCKRVDNANSHNSINTGTKRELVHPRIDLVGKLAAFQADDEGSIPFIRSNVFKHLHHGHSDILTSGLLLILTIVRCSFTPRAASWRLRLPASWSALRSAVGPSRICGAPGPASPRRPNRSPRLP